ncbi:MAG: IS1634 family transposase, partial [Terriglobia bacterium]
MFLRAHTSGKHTYLRLVESYREQGQPRQRVVAHLGRQDLLAPHLDSLVRLLQADPAAAPRWVAAEQVTAPQAWSWGPLRVARHLFDELALGPILDGVSKPRRHGQPLSERVFVLLANRLSRPGSEQALAEWLEDFYVVTAAGSRWQPQWKQTRRVKVAFEQLRLWYQTLDDLLAHKEQIETELWRQLRDLFSLAPELVFYDLTSTYFEGQGPAQLGRFGYSRDSQPRKRQVLVGVVMMQGWPLAHHVFAGNRLDHTTLLEVVADLRRRFGLERVVWVGDRGMVTLGNLEELRQADQGYLMGLQRRNRQDIADYIAAALARDRGQECPAGITAAEKAQPPRTRVQEVAGKQPGVRVFVVDSEEREQYERQRREQARERVREQLERLQQRVERGTLKQPEKIGAAAAAILGRRHGHRYFQWELRQGQFHYAPHEVNF